MATSASQPYIAKLGFQDKDRSTDRHGLACEYLFERLLELEVGPFHYATQRDWLQREINYRARVIAGERSLYVTAADAQAYKAEHPEWLAALENLKPDPIIAEAIAQHAVGDCLNVPITNRSYVNGFADVLIRHRVENYRDRTSTWLGEVKITKEPAETVLQQINFYLSFLDDVQAVYVLTDYEPQDLQRICVGTKIKVFRLGQRFEQWLANRPSLVTGEL
jgi:hypothetical protein